MSYVYQYIGSMYSWLKVSVFKSGKNYVSRYKEVVIKGVRGEETFEYN